MEEENEEKCPGRAGWGQVVGALHTQGRRGSWTSSHGREEPAAVLELEGGMVRGAVYLDPQAFAVTAVRWQEEALLPP